MERKKRIPSRVISVLSGLLVGVAGYILYRFVTGFEVLQIPEFTYYFDLFKYGLIGVTVVLALLGLLNIPVGFKIVKIILCLALAGALFFAHNRANFYLGKVAATFGQIPDKGKTEFSIYVPANADTVNPKTLGVLWRYNVDNLQEEALKQLNDGSYETRLFANNVDLLNYLDGKETGGAVLDWRYVEATWTHFRMHGSQKDPKTKKTVECNFEKEFKQLKSVVLEYDNYNSNLKAYEGKLMDKPFVIAFNITDKWNYAAPGIDGFTCRTYDSKVLIVNPNTHEILIATIPRDGQVLTTVNGNYGRDLMTNTSLFGSDVWAEAVENFIGTPVDFVVRLELTDLIPLVDALGGVTVNTPKGFPSKTINVLKNGEMVPYEKVFNTGNTTLTGEEAYIYIKETEELVNGEDGRDQHFLALMIGLAQKFTDVKNLFNNRDAICEALNGLLITNVNGKQLISFALDEILHDNSSWLVKPYSFIGYDSRDEYLSMYGQFADGQRIYYSLEERFKGTVNRIMNNKSIVDY